MAKFLTHGLTSDK